MARTPKISWQAKHESLRALSVRQPWAWLIVNGYKDVENRTRLTRHRGPLLIHAGMSREDMIDSDDIEIHYHVRIPDDLDFGGVIGVVEVSDCLSSHASAWYIEGNYAWVLAKPQRLPFRPCKGSLGLFSPSFCVLQATASSSKD